MSLSNLALWYASRSRVQLREASSHFERYRYPECVMCAQDSIELGIKAIFEFVGYRDYPYDHDVFEENVKNVLLAASRRYSHYNQQLSRATLISDRWANMARTIARYGQQALGVTGSEIINKADAESAINDAQEIVDSLYRIEKEQKFQTPIQVAILNGYVDNTDDSEVPCTIAPYSNFSIPNWETFLKNRRINNHDKYLISRISISEISNRYALIVNPFGESYPEKNFLERTAFEIIKNYVSDGGLFATTGGFAFYYGWDVNPNAQGRRNKPILDEKILIPVSLKATSPTTVRLDQFQISLPFSGSLLWKYLDARTTGDSLQFQGPYEGPVYQNHEDIEKIGDITNIGGSNVIYEFRALTKESKNCVPLLRLTRPDFGEVYPIGAIKYGKGYFIIGGVNNVRQIEFDKLTTSIDHFCDWFSQQ